MDIRELILQILEKRGEIKTSDVVQITGFSRVYINRFLRELRDDGKIILLGRANRARYVPATEKAVTTSRKSITKWHRILRNEDLLEDRVLDEIRNTTGIFMGIPENIAGILSYGFTEMQIGRAHV